MEQIIADLLDNKNAVNRKAELQIALKCPEAIPNLFEILVTSNEPQQRLSAAELLLTCLKDFCNWRKLSGKQRSSIKQRMLVAIVAEPKKFVRYSIACLIVQLVAQADKWMLNVLKYVFRYCSSNDQQQREVGTAIFSDLVAIAPQQIIPHIGLVCEMFSAALVAAESSNNMSSLMIVNILDGLSFLAVMLGMQNAREVFVYQKSIRYTVQALNYLAIHDTNNFIKSFDILEVIAVHTPKLLKGSSLKLLLNFCVEISVNFDLKDEVRVRACAYLAPLANSHIGSILKQKLVEPFFRAVFNLMATASKHQNMEDVVLDIDQKDEESYDYYSSEESEEDSFEENFSELIQNIMKEEEVEDDVETMKPHPQIAATQIMHQFAMCFPSQCLVPPLLALLDSAVRGGNTSHKRACYLLIAATEGCSEEICGEYLMPLMNAVKIGTTDPNSLVRSAALFALGKFSDYLYPESFEKTAEALAIIFDFFSGVCVDLRNGKKEPPYTVRMFIALEAYCNNLGEAAVPFLPVLLERIFEILDAAQSIDLSKWAWSSLQKAISAIKTHMLAYVPQMIDVMVRTINIVEPELRKILYSLFVVLAQVIGSEMDNEGVSLIEENTYWKDKERAIHSMKLLVEHTRKRTELVSCTRLIIEAIYKQLEHPKECIRKVANITVVQFIDSLIELDDLDSWKACIRMLIPKYINMLNGDGEYASIHDNVFGSLARLIIANSKLVPLEQVWPLFIEKLSLCENWNENKQVFKSFHVILTQGCESLWPFLNDIILFGALVLHRKQYNDDETRQTIYNLLIELRTRYTDNFNHVVINDAEVAAFAASCAW